jgi:hypothetical protein
VTRRPPPLPDPPKPVAEMTAEEQRAYLRSVLRVIRDDQVRRGSRRPRTMRETEIMLEGSAERRARHSRRIARAKRRRGTVQDTPVSPEGSPET